MPLDDPADDVDEVGNHMTLYVYNMSHMVQVRLDRNWAAIKVCQIYDKVNVAVTAKTFDHIQLKCVLERFQLQNCHPLWRAYPHHTSVISDNLSPNLHL